MEQYTQPETSRRPLGAGETSIFDDTPPPQIYYSQRAIHVFSVVFSVLFGMVLMVMNLNKTEVGKKAVPQVIVFGIGYAAIIWVILQNVAHTNSALTIALNAIGGYVLSQLFWNKYIGKGAPYTKRSVLVPTIIGMLIIAVFLGMIYVTGGFGE